MSSSHQWNGMGWHRPRSRDCAIRHRGLFRLGLFRLGPVCSSVAVEPGRRRYRPRYLLPNDFTAPGTASSPGDVLLDGRVSGYLDTPMTWLLVPGRASCLGPGAGFGFILLMPRVVSFFVLFILVFFFIFLFCVSFLSSSGCE